MRSMPTTALAQHPPSVVLSRLLDDELAYSPSFRRYYSSHLAMALVALEQMGASPDVLERTFSSHRGEPRTDTDQLADAIAEVLEVGIDESVRRRVPDLADATATALFHPAIRLAYALDIGHPGQVAAALLDWETRREVLPLPEPTSGTRRLADVSGVLSAQPPGTWEESYDFAGVAVRPELADAIAGLARDEHTLDDLVDFAAAAHATADHFLSLHMVTGARAIHRIAQLLEPEDARRLAAGAAETMVVAYASLGAPPLLSAAELDELRCRPLPDRAEIAHTAVQDRDPHVIKLANVALVEEERTGDPLYRYLAAHVVHLA